MENEVKFEWSKNCEGKPLCTVFANSESTHSMQITIRDTGTIDIRQGGIDAIFVSSEELPTLIELLTLARDGEFAPPEPEHIRLLRNAREILKDIPYLPRRENEIICDLRKEIEAYLEKEKMNEESD